MTRWRRRLVLPLALGLTLGLGGGALAAFSTTTANGPNRFVAAPDWEPPRVVRTVIAKTVGALTGRIRQGSSFYVYAQIVDGGNPPAGVGTVTADVSSISNGGGAVAMVAGAYTAGGAAYNYRSTARNAINTMAEGTRTYAITMSDLAVPVHTQTQSGFPVVIDNTAPVPAGWTATNRAGGVVGRAEPGDVVTYTWSEPIDPASLVPGWDGTGSVTVAARISNGGGNDRLRIRDTAGVTTLPFGTVTLGGNYVSASVTFLGSTLTLTGSTATVVLGTPAAATTVTATAASTARWRSNAGAYDAAGVPCAVMTINGTGSPRIWF